VRNSDSFKDEYKSLRIAAKIHLDAHLSEIMNHDLKFLKKCFKWNSMYEKKYKKEAKFSTEMLSSEEVENLVNKLSNKKGSLARQNAYVEFLGEQILELVKGTPEKLGVFSTAWQSPRGMLLLTTLKVRMKIQPLALGN
jgi:hypothetical protein